MDIYRYVRWDGSQYSYNIRMLENPNHSINRSGNSDRNNDDHSYELPGIPSHSYYINDVDVRLIDEPIDQRSDFEDLSYYFDNVDLNDADFGVISSMHPYRAPSCQWCGEVFEEHQEVVRNETCSHCYHRMCVRDMTERRTPQGNRVVMQARCQNRNCGANVVRQRYHSLNFRYEVPRNVCTIARHRQQISTLEASVTQSQVNNGILRERNTTLLREVEDLRSRLNNRDPNPVDEMHAIQAAMAAENNPPINLQRQAAINEANEMMDEVERLIEADIPVNNPVAAERIVDDVILVNEEGFEIERIDTEESDGGEQGDIPPPGVVEADAPEIELQPPEIPAPSVINEAAVDHAPVIADNASVVADNDAVAPVAANDSEPADNNVHLPVAEHDEDAANDAPVAVENDNPAPLAEDRQPPAPVPNPVAVAVGLIPRQHPRDPRPPPRDLRSDYYHQRDDFVNAVLRERAMAEARYLPQAAERNVVRNAEPPQGAAQLMDDEDAPNEDIRDEREIRLYDGGEDGQQMQRGVFPNRRTNIMANLHRAGYEPHGRIDRNLRYEFIHQSNQMYSALFTSWSPDNRQPITSIFFNGYWVIGDGLAHGVAREPLRRNAVLKNRWDRSRVAGSFLSARRLIHNIENHVLNVPPFILLSMGVHDLAMETELNARLNTQALIEFLLRQNVRQILILPLIIAPRRPDAEVRTEYRDWMRRVLPALDRERVQYLDFIEPIVDRVQPYHEDMAGIIYAHPFVHYDVMMALIHLLDPDDD
ncbi:uncharacterized protein LOC135843694 isoform X2 [Planococcus citri]|uniref:uncharacterized protein LOC135843694 isoform X2 n=1 Tax=Planococcus citri TaxID=170843 RepID=UPI0031F74FBC